MQDYLRQQNTEQRETITKLEETTKALQKQHSEAIKSLYDRFVEISKIGHSNDVYKNIKMLDIADTTIEELNEDIIKELVDDHQSIN